MYSIRYARTTKHRNARRAAELNQSPHLIGNIPLSDNLHVDHSLRAALGETPLLDGHISYDLQLQTCKHTHQLPYWFTISRTLVNVVALIYHCALSHQGTSQRPSALIP